MASDRKAIDKRVDKEALRAAERIRDDPEEARRDREEDKVRTTRWLASIQDGQAGRVVRLRNRRYSG